MKSFNGRGSTCPQCGYTGFIPRKTNHGHANCLELVYFLNTETPYEAHSEPKAIKRRPSGATMRPDIQVRRKDSRPGDQFIYVERQEQNTSGTGYEKIPNKLHKALEALRDRSCCDYYIVLAGARLDLLLRAAKDALARGMVYDHERMHVVDETEFKRLASLGLL